MGAGWLSTARPAPPPSDEGEPARPLARGLAGHAGKVGRPEGWWGEAGRAISNGWAGVVVVHRREERRKNSKQGDRAGRGGARPARRQARGGKKRKMQKEGPPGRLPVCSMLYSGDAEGKKIAAKLFSACADFMATAFSRGIQKGGGAGLGWAEREGRWRGTSTLGAG